MKIRAGRVALTGLLGALALALSMVEGMLPPIPGMPPGARLGLSNIVTMYAAGGLGLWYAIGISAVKGCFALLTRGGVAGIMSLSGGLFSTAVMWMLLRKTGASLSLVAVCGAIAHNMAQLAAARVLIDAPVLFYLPPLLLFGVLTGLATGTVLKLTMPHLNRVAAELLKRR